MSPLYTGTGGLGDPVPPLHGEPGNEGRNDPGDRTYCQRCGYPRGELARCPACGRPSTALTEAFAQAIVDHPDRSEENDG